MSKKNTTHSIINNLIDPVLFSSIRNTLTGGTFFWFYNNFVNYKPCDGYKFTNEIVKDSNLTHQVFINYLHMIKPALEKITHKKLHSVRFNLFLKTIKPEKYIINHHKPNTKVAILFANNTDGGIEIDNNFIESTENQLVSFDSDIEYKVVTPTTNKIFTYAIINYE
jgi:hypothetical protein|tara:strand:- start:166 stop:666 length:501 start_codon:yes stop_codon:yes gene_type:complete